MLVTGATHGRKEAVLWMPQVLASGLGQEERIGGSFSMWGFCG